MPTYDYLCYENGEEVEIIHGINEKIETWGGLCARAGIPLGDTPASSPVKKLFGAPGLAFPKTNTDLKGMGFTKLVKREKGVYENVTATGGESRYVRGDDPATMPNLKGKIGD